ncbi:hypothetical protein [Capnocytophaga canis]|nr:hypothetical protein [Capnocytophaga canis]
MKNKPSVIKRIFVILVTILFAIKGIDAIKRFIAGWKAVSCNCSQTK